MLWGGLLPIPRQLALDLATLIGLTASVLLTRHENAGALVLLASSLLTVSTSGFTNRWTLTLPMIPLIVFYGLRRLLKVSCSPPLQRSWLVSRILTGLCLLCIATAAALTVLFPAVQLPEINGRYHVGILDFEIPMEIQIVVPSGSLMNDTDDANETSCSATTTTTTTIQQYLPVRLLYPTLQKPVTRIPYLNPETAAAFCRQSMKFGAPSPLKNLEWMLHNWRLTTIPAVPEAPPVITTDDNTPTKNETVLLPLAIFSHGLGGNAEIYTYQTMELAAHGTVVLALNHLDGSAPTVPTSSSAAVEFDHEIVKLWTAGKKVEYTRERRARTERRVAEFIAATEFLLQHQQQRDDSKHKETHPILSRVIGPINLQTDHTFFMGHSFGGATALTAAKRRQDLVKAVIAHEPAVDWMPDDARRDLFEDSKIRHMDHNFTGGTGGYENERSEKKEGASSIHDMDVLILNSEEWKKSGDGETRLLQAMHAKGLLGKRDGISTHAFIQDTQHNEFSDTSMMTPTWLARSVGITGPRNPIDSAREIAQRTRAFLEQARQKR